jgi:Protein of unknown function DUF262
MFTEEKKSLEDINSTESVLLEEQFVPEELEEELPPIAVDGRDRRLVTHPYDFIIRSLKEQVDDESLILADNFQRRRVWDDAKSSRLIESLLINVPIPVCYFAEVDDAYSVIDGQQRLTAIYRYLNNEFELKSLKVRPDLNKKRFHELGVSDQRTIKNRSIRCIVILKESDPDIRFDVFDRLNSNSVKLNAQELRNSLYRSKLNDLIKELSEEPVFQSIRGVKNVDKRMQDCEMVLRFFAFHFQSEQYRGNFSQFFDGYLKNGRGLNSEELDRHRQIFLRVVADINDVFGKDSFRRYDNESKEWDKFINKSIYDIVMLYFARIDSLVIKEKKIEIVDALKKLCSDDEFNAAIGGGTSATIRVRTRLDKWYQSLKLIGISVEKIQIGQHIRNEE